MSDEHIRKMIKSMREHVSQTDLAWLSTYDQAQALYTRRPAEYWMEVRRHIIGSANIR